MLRKTILELERSLETPWALSAWKALRGTHPVLAAYPTAHDVLAALAVDTDDWTEKELLTRALLDKLQRQRDALWSALLVVAYAPMLYGMRRRFWRDFVEPDELDQLVLTALLDAARAFPLHEFEDRTALRLKALTHKRLRAIVRQLDKERGLVAGNEELADGREAPFADVLSEASPLDRAEAVLLLKRIAPDIVKPQYVGLIVSSLVYRERLRRYVFRAEAFGNEAQYMTVYWKLKRRRGRVMKRLRELLRRCDGKLASLPTRLEPAAPSLVAEPDTRHRIRRRRRDDRQLDIDLVREAEMLMWSTEVR